MVAIKIIELAYERRLEIVLYRNGGEGYLGTSKVIGCSKVVAFGICKKFEKTRSVKNVQK